MSNRTKESPVSTLNFSSSLSTSKESQTLPMSGPSPVGSKEAVCEVLQLISNLNNPVKVRYQSVELYSYYIYSDQAKQSETALLKLQRKSAPLFSSVCLYCDVSVLLGEFQFRSSSRKFIQQLFVECFEQVDTGQMNLF